MFNLILVNNNKIMLFMKGTKEMPMCGFSATVVNLLNLYAVEYHTTNKTRLSNWYTGNDINDRFLNIL